MEGQRIDVGYGEGYCIECRCKYKLREKYTNNHLCPYCMVEIMKAWAKKYKKQLGSL